MPSINFEDEKAAFRKFYDEKQTLLVQSCESYRTLIKALLTSEAIAVSKVEARVKDREECIRKFFRKYLPALEEQRQPYEIAPHITDLIGLRVVCLYEDELAVVAELLRSHLTVISVTDKVGEMENSEGRFGYKGLHMDLRLAVPRTDMPEYKLYSDFPFEVQLRTIVQDSWSVLDHKIKYKKAIPIALKRRINLLAALFELADREFRQIRDETAAAIEAEQAGPEPESELGLSRSWKERAPTNNPSWKEFSRHLSRNRLKRLAPLRQASLPCSVSCGLRSTSSRLSPSSRTRLTVLFKRYCNGSHRSREEISTSICARRLAESNSTRMILSRAIPVTR